MYILKNEESRDICKLGNGYFVKIVYLGDGICRHLGVTPAGGIYEARGMDPSWNIDWTAKIKIGADRWTADITLPFSSLVGERPENGETWKSELSVDFYQKRIVPAVARGAVLFLVSYYGIEDLQRKFGDETFKVGFWDEDTADPRRPTWFTTNTFATTPTRRMIRTRPRKLIHFRGPKSQKSIDFRDGMIL